MREIAVFDFDGTLTRRDSFIEFARFTVGTAAFACALFRSLPDIVRWKLGCISSSQAKEALFARLYKGMSAERFNDAGVRFADKIKEIERREIVDKLREYVCAGTPVYIISAGMPQWIEPWAKMMGVTAVEGTVPEVAEGKLTGRFESANCLGEEKVRRFEALNLRPCRLVVYGDSSGDDAILAIADEAHRVCKTLRK